jgi:dTDP-4-amino-4,6-dideoxygalactose transaminase
MGVAQLECLDEFVEKKRTIAAQYQEGLGDLDGIGLMAAQPDTSPVYWLYTALLGPSTNLEDRKLFVKKLNEAGFGARPLWRPLHLLPPYEDCQSFMIDQAVSLYNRAVSLPSSVGLESDDQQRCISTFRALADSMKVLA